jgi:hypothetical protein
MIETPELITAKTALLNGKKTLSIINGDRSTVGVVFGKTETILTIEFDTEIDWLDVSVHLEKFSSEIKVKGLGYDVKDMRKILTIPNKHTYRFNLPERAKGILTISSKGGNGTASLYNISGYQKEQIT